MTFKEHLVEYCWRLVFTTSVLLLIFGSKLNERGEIPEFMLGCAIGTAIYQLLKSLVIAQRGRKYK